MMKLVGCVLFALSIAAVGNAEAAVVRMALSLAALLHGVAGAAAGCAIAHHEAGKKVKAAKSGCGRKCSLCSVAVGTAQKIHSNQAFDRAPNRCRLQAPLDASSALPDAVSRRTG